MVGHLYYHNYEFSSCRGDFFVLSQVIYHYFQKFQISKVNISRGYFINPMTQA